MTATPSVSLYLIEPEPSAHWAPFVGVRPIAELRAGLWTIRERWESAVDSDAGAIYGEHIAHFAEDGVPACAPLGEIAGPAIVALSSFAPTGAAPTIGPDTRRLTAEGHTVGWIVPDGERWAGPGQSGPTANIEGIVLRGVYDLITTLERLLPLDCNALMAAGHDPLPAGSVVVGDAERVVSRGAMVEPGVVFDTRNGAVVLDRGAEVYSGARLEGPLYVGERCRILGGPLRFSVLGPRCNVRGELSNSIFLGYANKSHDGFVGHSVLGRWVNLGAGTTTSNLKNTYGEVSIDVAGTRLATGRQLLGSLIGDHAKTAIGTMLSTGTVVGAGAHLFGERTPPKFVPPMAWGGSSAERLTEAGFLKIAERVMPRRDVAFTPGRRASLAATYRRLTGP